MSISRIAMAFVAAIIVLVGVHVMRDPHRTRLPFGSTDLSAQAAPLARLDPEEAALVREYVKRSGGDVLPARFADPDDPFTARTFGEAIDLERRFRAKQSVVDTRVLQLQAQRTALLAPLRRVLTVAIAAREFVPVSSLYAPPVASTKGAIAALPDDRDVVLVTTWRVTNTSPFAIASFTAGAHAHRRGTPFSYVGQLDECWMDQRERLGPGESVDIRCGNARAGISAEDRTFAAMPLSDIDIEWIPKHIGYANGDGLDYKGD